MRQEQQGRRGQRAPVAAGEAGTVGDGRGSRRGQKEAGGGGGGRHGQEEAGSSGGGREEAGSGEGRCVWEVRGWMVKLGMYKVEWAAFDGPFYAT